MSLQDILKILPLIIISSIHEAFYFHRWYKTALEKSGKYMLGLLLGILRVLWMAACALIGIWLPICLLGFGLLTWGSALLCEKDRYRAKLLHTLVFLGFSTFLMMFIGASALIRGEDLLQVINDRRIRIWGLFCAQLVLFVGLRLVRRSPLDQLSIEHEYRQDKMFTLFLWCCVIYVYLDALFCLLVSDNLTVPVLLTAGNFLIFMLIIMFFHQKWFIAQNRTAHEEYEKLAAERAQEQMINEKMKKASEIDGLTGCFSRRFIDAHMRRLQEAGIDFSVVFIDIDRLKEINDRYGHGAGDRMLTGFVNFLTGQLRSGDKLARIGGDEFLIIMPRCDMTDADKRLDEIRVSMIERQTGSERVSFSYGVAFGGGDISGLIQKADAAMYADKRHNRRGGGCND